MQSVAHAVLPNVGQLHAQSLYTRETACRLGLGVLEIGQHGEEGHHMSHDLVHEVLLKHVSVVEERGGSNVGGRKVRRVLGELSRSAV